ncbi:TonB-dependent receptor plug domain-containing protein [uncultured Bacteroides sp.]|uniref:TonB-dependent receptor plug domain-containing protein n=1 Tax=uncultured Bacteroides sp. TaxID=162156 RepID=UPI002AAAA74D|nr:TonB-dependent receptor plug domain-containing protein [uncultured Bacteroides sp.]
MSNTRNIILSLLIWLCVCLLVQAQKPDSLRVHTLKEVVVKENKKEKEFRSTTPLQVLDANQLKQAGSLQVSDAVKFFSGVVVKDYGGIGGLKTISVRSLGANHTAVVYDGITITDSQTGQIDLGKLTLDNIEEISLSNGQSDNIFQSARLFSAASILNIKSPAPTLNKKNMNASATFKGGSFGFYNPSLHLDNRWSNIFSSSVHLDYMHADGDYPYTQLNGTATERVRRYNSDIETIKTEANLFAHLSDRQKASVKAYYYSSDRGLPSNKLYYSRATERLKDKNIFAQTNYENNFSDQWSLMVNGKFNWGYNQYNNPDNATYNAATENNYYQNEYYLSGTVMYRPFSSLSFSLANDGSINTMRADMANFVFPTRLTLLNALAAKFVNNRFTATAHILSTLTKESVKTGTAADNRNRLSPSVSLSYQLFKEENLRVRLLYKDIFRLPTFNDLYYGTIGTRTLKPEQASEYNAGLSWIKSINHLIPFISLSVDGFYNKVSNKIVAVPTKNLFVWSMRNIGRVDIRGCEANLETAVLFSKKVKLTATGNYTYQRAMDKTDKYNMPDKVTYNHQIPYTPRHSGSTRLGLEMPWINFSYTVMASGERYSNQYNAPEYRLEGYTEHSVSAWHTFKLKKFSVSAQAEVLNLFDKEYEIVQNYPMPGRQYRGSIRIIY